MNKFDESNYLCPGTELNDEARMLGVISELGVVYLGKAVKLPLIFHQEAKSQSAEYSFRFISSCSKRECIRLKDDVCDVASSLSRLAQHSAVSADIPECGVQKKCFWFFQEGKSACKACKYVVSDVRQSHAMKFAIDIQFARNSKSAA